LSLPEQLRRGLLGAAIVLSFFVCGGTLLQAFAGRPFWSTGTSGGTSWTKRTGHAVRMD